MNDRRFFSPFWTASQVEELRKLRAEGLPFAEIARQIGRTELAVRLKHFHDRAAATAAPKRRGRPPKNIAAATVPPASLPSSAAVIVNGRGAFAVWTPAELAEGARLRATGLCYRAIALVLGRTEQAVRHRIFRENMVENEDRKARVALSHADRNFITAFRHLYPDAPAQVRQDAAERDRNMNHPSKPPVPHATTIARGTTECQPDRNGRCSA